MRVLAQGLSISRGGRMLVDRLDLQLEPGTITVLAGPNGAGKSTLLETLAGDLQPSAGEIRYGGTRLADLSLQRRAEIRTMLCQHSQVAFDFTVQEVVAMGLHPHGLCPRSPQGSALVSAALAQMDLLSFAQRSATRLSGGEAQRVHIARSLVQLRGLCVTASAQSGVLLLDEPTNGLDYRHQLALVKLLQAEAAGGATILASLHDLPLACRLASRLLLLARGRVHADVHPAALEPALVADIYQIDPAEAQLLLGRGNPPASLRLAAE